MQAVASGDPMSSSLPGRRLVATLSALAASLLLVSCGGSTTAVEPFVAQRVFAFGDDASALTPEGRNYAVNGINSTTNAVDCTLLPNWVQVMAGFYGLAIAQCNNSTPPVEPRAFTLAAPGARVAEVAAQVETRAAAGGFRDRDLALVFVGMNDVLELYRQYPAVSEADLVAEARRRGEAAAGIVNRLVDLGAKVVVANVPEMGLSPFARAEAAANAGSGGTDRAVLMTRLSRAFNERLGVRIRADGRFVGLAQLELRTQRAGIEPAIEGLSDVANPACTVAPPDCTTATITTGVAQASALWADGTRLGTGGQSLLASLALQRVQTNPF
jgi:outer membrane lipase/esterase